MIYYPSELHTHTVFSDGTMQPEELVERALERGLRILCSTDHNNYLAAERLRAHAEGKPLLVVPGNEWTTFYGHLTVIGGNSPVDWRSVNKENINEKIAEAHRAGDAVTLAHPMRIGSHLCTGCYNYYDIQDWQFVSAIEVMTRQRPHINPADKMARQLWLSLLNRGHRIAAAYGYDWHNTDIDPPVYGKTYVGIEGEPTAERFLQAYCAGRTYLSMGITLDIAIKQDGKTFTMGDTLRADFAEVSVKIALDEPFCKHYGIRPQRIRIFGPAAVEEQAGENFMFHGKLNAGYFIIEVMGEAEGFSGTLALSSPIYVEEMV